MRGHEEMLNISEAVRCLLGEGAEPAGMSRVSGGDINEAYAVVLEDGRKIFVKANDRKRAGFFTAERAGLDAIRGTNTIKVPDEIAGGVAGDCACLILEFLEERPRKSDFWERFGRELADLHRADPSLWTPGGLFGFVEDNYIGAGEQINAVCGSWIAFFRERRLEPQFRKAQHYFDQGGRKQMQSLLDHLDDYLIEPEYPSLLHGDLWCGNFAVGPDGYAWLIDPAVYVGHAEADLAMTELFGGFAGEFYDAYGEANPIARGFKDRREIYNLYHLLNHLNLFGGSYYSAVMRVVRRYA